MHCTESLRLVLVEQEHKMGVPEAVAHSESKILTELSVE